MNFLNLSLINLIHMLKATEKLIEAKLQWTNKATFSNPSAHGLLPVKQPKYLSQEAFRRHPSQDDWTTSTDSFWCGALLLTEKNLLFTACIYDVILLDTKHCLYERRWTSKSPLTQDKDPKRPFKGLHFRVHVNSNSPWVLKALNSSSRTCLKWTNIKQYNYK